MLNKFFENLCIMSQATLKKFVEAKLRTTHSQVVSADGYVYAQGDFPVLLVAHLDTVHHKATKKEDLRYNLESMAVGSINGIGGDDRCGVYMIFEIIKKFNCSVVFCEDEEIGMVGANKFAKSALAKSLSFNYIIEFDRKGNNDAVFYDCDNPEFEDFITKEFFKTAYGTFTDICKIAPALKCAAVNLSCGYYKAHTVSEYVVLPEMERVITEACKILERTTENDKFEYIEFKYSGYGGYGGAYDDWEEYYGRRYGYDSAWGAPINGGGGSKNNAYSAYREKYYEIEYVDKNGKTQYYGAVAVSYEEAVGTFVCDHPSYCYDDIIAIYTEKDDVKELNSKEDLAIIEAGN